ncbi:MULTISPECIES: GlxA family transcriptional regulator [unclassified Janthinobacterium]|uniref:GlxA family transcriptional regulator n=1 Tax=unclassified Janthinobacterium TaxID=2610881 RepID=UPI0016122DBA|nr:MULTISPECIES: GlxA family transcriptional regulator [unclassified Janthinobacterium]MBB5370688.1 transcriptional regulator GlxA family with amidase domain [Janthinobacterium sp. K2C7]MBB5383494.1 transcriptional regulator GlxA family with amidase domain [Janthinobacterium sp. K2Li3]MBB5388948.1 transcriptional regulator GlxA family with amidase domain [Janthinobacterium sp. K2E3]
MIKQTPTDTPLRTVDIIVYPGFKALEAIGAMKVFDYANTHLRLRQLAGGYDVQIVSTTVGPVESDTLMSLHASKALDSTRLPDLAVIVGCHNVEEVLQELPAIATWVTEAAPRIPTLAALCTGCFFLAEAGILDGKSAATHWSAVDSLRQRYPQIKVNADAIFVREGNLWTSAGVTAGIDLALALVEDHFSRDIALEVARDLVVYLKRPGGQSQFSVHLASQMTTHPGMRQLQGWIMEHLAQPLTIPLLAARLAMSERNFTRVFQRETGASPTEFIETARFEVARRLLEDNVTSLKQVAAQTGLHSEERLRRLFHKKLGITPRDYRERFSSTRRE